MLALALGVAWHPQEAMEDSAAELVVCKLDIAFGAIVSNDLVWSWRGDQRARGGKRVEERRYRRRSEYEEHSPRKVPIRIRRT